MYVHSRFNLHKHTTLYREDLANVLPELYVAVADPVADFVVDYEKLCKFTMHSNSVCAWDHTVKEIVRRYCYDVKPFNLTACLLQNVT